MTRLKCIDLFCGAGGLTCGLQSTGIDVVAGVDVDARCRHPFEVNNDAEFLLEDVSELASGDLGGRFGSAEVRILAGCAPCQPFSTYSQRYETIGTPRWGLLYHFARLVRDLKPEIVAMENVPTVTKHQVYLDFADTLRKMDYTVWSEVVDCGMYGLPQSRRRTVLLASRIGPIQLTTASIRATRTVRSAIAEMPEIAAGETNKDDPLHVAASLSNLNLERIRASRPGGTWRDWPQDLVAACHRKSTGKTYPGVYGRMEWDKPSPTLTTQFFGFGNGRFGHPEQDRAISLREGAILQGFPRDYSFLPEGETIHFKTLGRLIGNAVPVTLGEIIGQSILDAIGLETRLDQIDFPDHDDTKKRDHSLVA